MEYKYKYQNNVQLMNNIVTNNFTIGVSNISVSTFETVNKEEIVALLDEQNAVFNAIDEVAKSSLEEKDICALMAKIIEGINKITVKNTTSLSVNINSIINPESSLVLNNFSLNRG